MIRNYTELIKLKSHKERLDYLKLRKEEYDVPREFSMSFYKSNIWKKVRQEVIVRDFGCDLGIRELPINDTIIVHHMNPVTIEQLESMDPDLLNPEYLISTSVNTHGIIHYRIKEAPEYKERKEGDTKLW